MALLFLFIEVNFLASGLLQLLRILESKAVNLSNPEVILKLKNDFV